MDYAGRINKPIYNDFFNSLRSIDNRNRQSKFKDVLENKIACFSEVNGSNCLKDAAVPLMLQRKINSMSDLKISDITRVHYPTDKEPGERVFETIMPGTGIRVNISLRPCSMDDDIDQNKLKEIFRKVFMFCEKVLPIEQKLSAGKIEAMGIMALPFDTETGEVDFKTYFKGVFEVGYARIRNTELGESVKEVLIKMLMECEKSLFEEFDEEEKQSKDYKSRRIQKPTRQQTIKPYNPYRM